MRKELEDTLREWLSDVCSCNGNNNLYYPQLKCLDNNTGSVISTVRHDGDMTAKMLIDLVVAAIHNNDPPFVSLSQHGWILYLIAANMTVNNSSTDLVSTNGNTGRPIVLVVCIGISCMVALLLIFIIAGLVYGIYKRYDIGTISCIL